ncbi:MAG: class I mannose-6-phosphate isomerase [Tenuifilaceae bacterium]|nr:class I mannose-6-phosphate isomerase [Tenuifilaceae bacterium]
MLYPLKFTPQLKPRIWGGSRLHSLYGKVFPMGGSKCGESWEISGVEGSLSVVSNGFLAGNNIQELIEVYMGDLVGENNYQKYGVEFPLLIKFIDTSDYLSIQVHPDDDMARRLHHAFGKSEMWYVISGSSESQIITGLNPKITREQYIELLTKGNLAQHLKYEPAQPDDFFYIPSRHLHALGKDLLLVEIQQTSDITYRVYDWNRVDENGRGRELHTELALKAIDFDANPIKRDSIQLVQNQVQELNNSPYFVVNRLYLNKKTERSFIETDTFRIYICMEGEAFVIGDGFEAVEITAGEVVLVPASISEVDINPKSTTKILEVFVK